MFGESSISKGGRGGDKRGEGGWKARDNRGEKSKGKKQTNMNGSALAVYGSNNKR